MAVYKKIVLGFLLCLLTLPLTLTLTKFVEFKPLLGIELTAVKPTLSAKTIFDGTFQDSAAKYIDENLGPRPFLVRINNQLKYTLFHTTSAPGVTIGKDGMFYIESYILEYCGFNFVGTSVVKENCRKIKAVQDTLKKHGTDFVVVIVPSKAHFYPEYIPDFYMFNKKDSINYIAYKEYFKKLNIEYVDFNSYFCSIKSKLKYPLYPHFGTHWTNYGVALTSDSLIKYFEKKRNVLMPHMGFSEVEMSDSLHGPDYDIGEVMNLFQTLKEDPMPYPKIKYQITDSVKYPSALVVGDSYWWVAVGLSIPSQIFDNDIYWFYNREEYINNQRQETPVKDLCFKAETYDKDIIILMATPATLHQFPYGFIDNAYYAYCMTHDEKLIYLENKIKNDNEWYKNIIKKARNSKISVDEQLKLEETYIIDQEEKRFSDEIQKKDAHQKKIDEMIQGIKADTKWLATEKESARQNYRSIAKQLQLDAEWMLNEQNKKKEK